MHIELCWKLRGLQKRNFESYFHFYLVKIRILLVCRLRAGWCTRTITSKVYTGLRSLPLARCLPTMRRHKHICIYFYLKGLSQYFNQQYKLESLRWKWIIQCSTTQESSKYNFEPQNEPSMSYCSKALVGRIETQPSFFDVLYVSLSTEKFPNIQTIFNLHTKWHSPFILFHLNTGYFDIFCFMLNKAIHWASSWKIRYGLVTTYSIVYHG